MLVLDGGYIVWSYGSSPERQQSWIPELHIDDYVAYDDQVAQLLRTKHFPEYKQRRQATHEKHMETYLLVQEFRKTCFTTLPRLIKIPGLEADDIIALLTWMRPGLRAIGIDKDLLQLKPRLASLQRIDGSEVTFLDYFRRLPEAVKQAGITTRQLPLVLALMGDKTDGIPRLIPPYELWRMTEILQSAKPETAALNMFGSVFLQNLMTVILPFPGIFGLPPAEVFEMYREGEYTPDTLLGQMEPSIEDILRRSLS